MPPQWPAVTLTFDLQNLIRSSVGGCGNSPSFIEIAQVVHEIWPAVTLTFYRWPPESNPVVSSVGASEYFLYVSSRLLKPFMRYRGNKICLHERMNAADGHKSINILLLLTLSVTWQRHNKNWHYVPVLVNTVPLRVLYCQVLVLGSRDVVSVSMYRSRGAPTSRLGLVSTKNYNVSVSAICDSCPRRYFAHILQATLIK